MKVETFSPRRRDARDLVRKSYRGASKKRKPSFFFFLFFSSRGSFPVEHLTILHCLCMENQGRKQRLRLRSVLQNFPSWVLLPREISFLAPFFHAFFGQLSLTRQKRERGVNVRLSDRKTNLWRTGLFQLWTHLFHLPPLLLLPLRISRLRLVPNDLNWVYLHLWTTPVSLCLHLTILHLYQVKTLRTSVFQPEGLILTGGVIRWASIILQGSRMLERITHLKQREEVVVSGSVHRVSIRDIRWTTKVTFRQEVRVWEIQSSVQERQSVVLNWLGGIIQSELRILD